MLFLISPAKALDYETPPHVKAHTQPLFVEQSVELIDVLKRKTPQQIGTLMDLSDKLASLNAARYEAWSPKFTAKNSKQAVLAFDGDVYGGLDAKTLSAEELDWLQAHLCILSGLYGVLRPLDWVQPYRLEMGTRFANPRGRDLYAYWGRTIAEHLDVDSALVAGSLGRAHDRSVGRFRSDLDAEQLADVEREAGELLSALGYTS